MVLAFANDKGMHFILPMSQLLHWINFQKSLLHNPLVTTPHFSTQCFGLTRSFLDTGLSFRMNALWRFQEYFEILTMQFWYLVSVMTLFMMSVEVRSPLIMETITVPCLRILLRLVKPPPPSSKNNKVHTFMPSLCCGQIDHPQSKPVVVLSRESSYRWARKTPWVSEWVNIWSAK